MPIKNKKYSKEHIILMNLIYNLKGTLSISDIKLVLNDLVNESDSDHIRDLYSKFIKTSESDLRHFKKENIDRFEEINSNDNDKFDKNFLMLCSVINMSNMYRKLGEKLIDELFDKGDEI